MLTVLPVLIKSNMMNLGINVYHRLVTAPQLALCLIRMLDMVMVTVTPFLEWEIHTGVPIPIFLQTFRQIDQSEAVGKTQTAIEVGHGRTNYYLWREGKRMTGNTYYCKKNINHLYKAV